LKERKADMPEGGKPGMMQMRECRQYAAECCPFDFQIT
jgi:hypothetical protein